MEILSIKGKEFQLSIKTFEELGKHELYEILKIRQEVFIVEQDCPYLDADGKDDEAIHVIIYDQKRIAAYTRILSPGAAYNAYSSIGRVLNGLEYRSKGVGKVLMEKSIEKAKTLYPDNSIKISAQCYLLKFYNSLGFRGVGDEYLEDNIPHKAMIFD